MRQIIEALKNFKGKNVNIYTEHKLFGKQHLQMRFKPETEIGFGFHVCGQIIYIDKNDIISYELDDKNIIINSNMMNIKIVQTS